jgi:hypothetical protein
MRQDAERTRSQTRLLDLTPKSREARLKTERTRHQHRTLRNLLSPIETGIGEEVLTSSSQLSSDDSPASRTRSRVRAEYMAATRATETTPEHIERVNQSRTLMASSRQQLRETSLTLALTIQEEIETNRLALKEDLHLAVNGHLPQKAFHEHAAINHMATDYLKIQFSQSLKYCTSCSEKWWNDPPGRDNIIDQCKRCFLETKNKNDTTVSFGFENDMDPLVHPNPNLRTAFSVEYSALVSNYQVTNIEEALFAKNAVIMQAFRLKGGRTGFSGNVICFPQRVSDIVTILPRKFNELKVIIARCKTGPDPSDYKDFKVRKNHVRVWLQFLIKWSPVYSDVILDQSNLDILPDDASIYNELVQVTNFDSVDNSTEAILMSDDDDVDDDYGIQPGPIGSNSDLGDFESEVEFDIHPDSVIDDVLISGIGERAEPLLSEVIIIQNTLNSMTFDNDEDQGIPDYEITVSSNIPISGGGSSGISDTVHQGKF